MSAIQWVSALFVFSQSLFFIEYLKLKKSFEMKQTSWFRGEFLSLAVIYFVSLFGILFHSSWVFTLTFALGYLLLLFKWRGNFNGGSDNMTFVILTGLFLAKFTRHEDTGLIYISILLTSSYVLAGWVKLKYPEWKTGESLIGFLSLSPIHKSNWQSNLINSKNAFYLARMTLLFELSFPLALFSFRLSLFYLFFGVLFHFSNWLFFGLNRFFWIWISAYPAILWMTSRS